jgi:glycerate kinase
MAMALGAKFLDVSGKSIGLGGAALHNLAAIDIKNFYKYNSGVEFIIASDVKNPLCGEKGAAKVYGSQKGATGEMIEVLDRNLLNLAKVIKKDLGLDIANVPGAGAAVGLEAGLLAFFRASMQNGFDIVLDAVKIDDKIQNVDIVITGEGRIDGQTVFGKAPIGIAKRAKKYSKPVFGVAGYLDKGYEAVYDYGIDSVVSSMVGPMPLESAIADSPRMIKEAVVRLFRVIKATGNIK